MYGCGYGFYFLNKILLTGEYIPPFIPYYDGIKNKTKSKNIINWSGKFIYMKFFCWYTRGTTQLMEGSI